MKLNKDIEEEMELLCMKHGVEKKNWFKLAVKLSQTRGEILQEPKDKGGRPRGTMIHHILTWLQVQQKVDMGHSQKRACELLNISRSQYYEAKKSDFVILMMRLRKTFGPVVFWKITELGDWEDIRDIDLRSWKEAVEHTEQLSYKLRRQLAREEKGVRKTQDPLFPGQEEN